MAELKSEDQRKEEAYKHREIVVLNVGGKRC